MAELTARGGGPVLGVAMLDTGFPRLPGDIGNAASFDFPVMYETVSGAGVARAVTDGTHDPTLVDAFLAAGKTLVKRGATLVATSCGFLGPLQARMANALPVPVVTSALIDLPVMRARSPADQAIGILTFDARKLTARHLPPEWGPYQVVGMENGRELYPAIAGNRPGLDPGRAQDDVAMATARLLASCPDPALIILECTNLPPYRDVVANLFTGPVYDIRDAIRNRVAQGAAQGVAQGTEPHRKT